MKLKNSKIIYNRSKKVLSGPSTFSKGIDQFAYGVSPYAIDKSIGAYAWDIDGNKYLDTIMSLGAVFIGHNNSTINNSIKNQLKKGTTFSLASKLETEVAEMLTDRIPGAEMIKFGKNGNDVTSAAIRLARHYSRSDHILFCGYHGWQDWYTCQTSMDGGIPKTIKKYSHRFEYGDLEALEILLKKFKNNTACIILEPVSKTEPICKSICGDCKKLNICKGYLKGVRKLADKYRTILIFDEVVTGFRFHRGGYQALCKVTPDLSCFSKSMANGMPIAALAGKKEIMKKSNEIFYSLTFGGETLSLAAAKSVLDFIDKNNVVEHVFLQGNVLMQKINVLLHQLELNDVIEIRGFPQKNFMIFKNYQENLAEDLRTYWIQQITINKVLSLGTHLLSFSHKKKEINYLLDVYEKVFLDFKKVIKNENLHKVLKCPTAKSSARDL
jgi:glutamate-1-semialdehyde 2,1-aminomutase